MRIGVIADTHVPYRAAEIPPSAIESLQGVDLILHAGDVDEPWALVPLAEIAPVHAVRGNYHILDRSSGGASLPAEIELTLAGFSVALTHGHNIGPQAMLWKVLALLRMYTGHWDFPAYDAAIAKTLVRRFPKADVIVFGHTHRFYWQRWGNTYLANPGAVLPQAYFLKPPCAPTVAHLVLEPGASPTFIAIPL
ncbi:MAG: metallophosphoesterase family protein [Anaerolineae bacterium]|nr:metallophosphoesterase family protein [Anaerolineae bacterium]